MPGLIEYNPLISDIIMCGSASIVPPDISFNMSAKGRKKTACNFN